MLAGFTTGYGKITPESYKIKYYTDWFRTSGIKLETPRKAVECLLDTVFPGSMDFESEVHMPYRKPGYNPKYVSAFSNHLTSTLKGIPGGAKRRLKK